MFLAVFGAVFAPPADRRVHWLLICVIAFVCGLHTIVFGHSRYHLPLMSLVLVYTTGALADVGSIWQQRGSRKFLLAVGACAVLVAGWVWSIVAVDWERFVAAWHSVG
jgi:hypothetical protein